MEDQTEQFSRQIQDKYRQRCALEKTRLMSMIVDAIGNEANPHYQTQAVDLLVKLKNVSVYDKRIPKMISGEIPAFETVKRTGKFETLKQLMTNKPSAHVVTTTPVYLRDGSFLENVSQAQSAIVPAKYEEIYEPAGC